MAISRYAVIEIAASEIMMKVYEVSPRIGIRVVNTLRRGVPLGQDTYVDGKISADVLDMVCDILQSFRKIEKEYRTEKTLAIGTSAVRDARNCAMVLDQIHVRTGYNVEAMSNSTQRFVRLKGAATQGKIYSLLEAGSLLVDIGAGSIQVSIFEKTSMVSTQNITLGVMKISEMFNDMSGDFVSVERMVEELIDNDVQTFEKMFLKGREIKNVIIVGDGATSFIRTRLEQSKEKNLTTAEILMNLSGEVIGSSVSEISRRLEIPMEYASLMTPMMMIYRAFMETSHADTVVFPKSDLCDGYMLDYAERKGIIKPSHDFNEDILAASRNISRRYQGNKKHTQTVEGSVLQIFDAMKKYHGLGARERLLLQIAAILHDCGKFISMSAPGECAYRIIMATEILGLSHNEREMVANIVRCNTLPIPSYDEMEGKLSEEDYLAVNKLTAILRVGNALDRSHKQKFTGMKLAIKDSKMTITTEYPDDILLEKSTLENRNRFFEEIYGIRLQIRQKKRK